MEKILECKCGSHRQQHNDEIFCPVCGKKFIKRNPRIESVVVWFEGGSSRRHVSLVDFKKELDKIK
jgi:uncharacterized Zn finger protein (UPF0148 family)